MAALLTRLDGQARAILAAAAIGGLLLSTIGPVEAATTVNVKALATLTFMPDHITITAGDTVHWAFSATGDPHTVTSGEFGAIDAGDQFDSDVRGPGGSFEVQFKNPGTFPYFCRVHGEQMTGTITVKAAPTPRPTPRVTPKPSPKPTVRPTTKPTETPSSAPSPTPTALPTQSAAPSVAPTASPTGSPSGASAEPSPASSPSPTATPSPDAGAASASLDPAAIVAGAIVIGLLALGGFALARRSRSA